MRACFPVSIPDTKEAVFYARSYLVSAMNAAPLSMIPHLNGAMAALDTWQRKHAPEYLEERVSEGEG